MAVTVTSVAHSVLPGSTPGKTLRLEAKRSRQRPDRMLTRGPSLWGLCWNQNHALLRQALRGDATWLWAQRGDNVQDELHDGTGGLAQELMGPGARSPRRSAGTRRRMWVKDLS